MNQEQMNEQMNKNYSKLLEAFREHGTCWYQREESYDLSNASDVEGMLQRSGYFGDCRYTDAQVQAVSSLIARAAVESGNDGWIFHPDIDSDYERATREISVPICAIVEADLR